jgi:hypothetical protein
LSVNQLINQSITRFSSKRGHLQADSHSQTTSGGERQGVNIISAAHLLYLGF